jgi:hypothetical protein
MITIEESFSIIQKLLVAGFETKTGEAALFPDAQRSVWLSGTNPGTNYQCAISCPGLEGSHICRVGTTPSNPCSFGPEERCPITLSLRTSTGSLETRINSLKGKRP